MYVIPITLLISALLAQHEHMSMPMQTDAAREFLMAEASGTGHDPAAAPMAMKMTQIEGWSVMAHGTAFLSQVVQTGRGADQFFSTNWIMASAERPLAGGHLMLRSMLSLEPLTVPKRGYPELFQVGEGLVDRQHPHDLFMELGAQFAVDVGHQTVGYIYAAPVGDPALGPVAFPHRASAAELPQAPLSHHLQDSTHIAASVLTIGAQQKQFGAAISGFHGQEPDNSNRWDIDRGRADSWSVRGTWDPTANWSAQFSTGHLHQPERDEPGDLQRTTASIAHSTGEWSSTVAWGWNHKSDHDQHSLLAETNRRFNVSNYLTGRFEIVRGVRALTGGYTKDIFRSRDLLGGVGGNVTVYRAAGERPLSFYVFARLRSPSH
jgi:hypothetical protein